MANMFFFLVFYQTLLSQQIANRIKSVRPGLTFKKPKKMKLKLTSPLTSSSLKSSHLLPSLKHNRITPVTMTATALETTIGATSDVRSPGSKAETPVTSPITSTSTSIMERTSDDRAEAEIKKIKIGGEKKCIEEGGGKIIEEKQKKRVGGVSIASAAPKATVRMNFGN